MNRCNFFILKLLSLFPIKLCHAHFHCFSMISRPIRHQYRAAAKHVLARKEMGGGEGIKSRSRQLAWATVYRKFHRVQVNELKTTSLRQTYIIVEAQTIDSIDKV